jgi:hypothetical protein
LLKSRIFVNQSTDVEHEVRSLESLARKHSLDDATTDALIAEARGLLADFCQTAIDAANGHFSAEISKTIKGPKYEVAFVLRQEPLPKRGGIMSLFRR